MKNYIIHNRMYNFFVFIKVVILLSRPLFNNFTVQLSLAGS
jgi:hypothetical protein